MPSISFRVSQTRRIGATRGISRRFPRTTITSAEVYWQKNPRLSSLFFFPATVSEISSDFPDIFRLCQHFRTNTCAGIAQQIGMMHSYRITRLPWLISVTEPGLTVLDQSAIICSISGIQVSFWHKPDLFCPSACFLSNGFAAV